MACRKRRRGESVAQHKRRCRQVTNWYNFIRNESNPRPSKSGPYPKELEGDYMDDPCVVKTFIPEVDPDDGPYTEKEMQYMIEAEWDIINMINKKLAEGLPLGNPPSYASRKASHKKRRRSKKTNKKVLTITTPLVTTIAF